MAVVVGGHADDLVAHPGHAARVDAVGTAVADRRHDDHALLHEVRRSLARRRLVPVVEGVADRHVQDVHVVVERPLHRGDHDLVGRGAFAAEDAVRAERDARSDARDLAVCADDARDVRAVPVAVVRDRIRRRSRAIGRRGRIRVVRVTHEVPLRDDAGVRERRTRRPVPAEVRVVEVDARVHHGDLDPFTRQAELVLGDVRARHLDRRREIRNRRRRRLRDRDGVDRIDRLDVRQGQHLLELPGADLDREAVPELLELVAGLVRDPRLLRVGVELLPLRCQGCGVTAVCHRVPGQLDEPGADHVLGHLAVADVGRRADLPRVRAGDGDGYEQGGKHPEQCEQAPVRHWRSSHCLLSPPFVATEPQVEQPGQERAAS